MIIKLKMNVKKINKERLYVGEKGTYLNAVLIEKPNDYGDDGFICEDVSKEERQQGVKGTILGSWKIVSGKPRTADQATEENADGVPF